jgi:hypothetical protein
LVCATIVNHLKVVILPVVLYVSENWSPILWDGQRLRVFENRVMRRIMREEKCIQSFGRKMGRKGPLGRLRQRWADNIKMNFKEIDCRMCTVFIWLWIVSCGRLL